MDQRSSYCLPYTHFVSQRPLPSTTVAHNNGSGWGSYAPDAKVPARSSLAEDFSDLVADIMDFSLVDLSAEETLRARRIGAGVPELVQKNDRQSMSTTYVISRQDDSGLSDTDEDSPASSFTETSLDSAESDTSTSAESDTSTSAESDTSTATESTLCELDLTTGHHAKDEYSDRFAVSSASRGGPAAGHAEPGGRPTPGFVPMPSDVRPYNDAHSDDFLGYGREANFREMEKGETGDLISTSGHEVADEMSSSAVPTRTSTFNGTTSYRRPRDSDTAPVVTAESQLWGSVVLSPHTHTFSDASLASYNRDNRSKGGRENSIRQSSAFLESSDIASVASTSARESLLSGSVVLSAHMYTFSDASVAPSDDQEFQTRGRTISLRRRSDYEWIRSSTPVASTSTAAASANAAVRNSQRQGSPRSKDAISTRTQAVGEEEQKLTASDLSTTARRPLKAPPASLQSRPDVCSENWNASVWKVYKRLKVAPAPTASPSPAGQDVSEPGARRNDKGFVQQQRSSAQGRPLPPVQKARSKLAQSKSHGNHGKRVLIGCACSEASLNTSSSSEWISWTWSDEHWSRHVPPAISKAVQRPKKSKKGLLKNLKEAFTRCCGEARSDVSVCTSAATQPSSSGPSDDSWSGSSQMTGFCSQSPAYDSSETSLHPMRLSFETTESESEDCPDVIDLNEANISKIMRDLQAHKDTYCLLLNEAEIANKLVQFLKQPEPSMFYKMSCPNKRHQMEKLAMMCFVKAVDRRCGITLTKTLLSRVPVTKDILLLRSC